MYDHSDTGFGRELIDAGLLVEAGVDGLYGRSETYEQIISALIGLATRTGAAESPTTLHFPPIVPRSLLVRTDYVKSFPDLVGSVNTFRGDDHSHADLLEKLATGADWTGDLVPTEVMLRPAACHPVYPLCAGRLPEGGRRFEVHGWCFRYEPSLDPMRMLAFRMHEFVYVGDPEGATSYRDRWLARGTEVFAALGLEIEIEPASDPFFGRLGRILAENQRDDALKLEFVTPNNLDDGRAAVASVNRHQDHFGMEFGIESADGTVAHSTCFAIGLDRTALSLLSAHGLEPKEWPATVRATLWP